MNTDTQKNIREVTIESVDKKGRGVGTTDTGGQLIVPFTIPGEQVHAEKQKRKLGSLDEVITPSIHRAQPRCKHFGVCGGCSWQHIAYEHQLRLKQETVERLFEHYHMDVPALPVNGSPEYSYRSRMDYVWWFDDRLGLRQAGKWHTVVDLEECRLIPPQALDLVFEIHYRAIALGLPFRDSKKKTPGLRYLIVRCGIHTADVMINIVSDSMELPRDLWANLDELTSINHLINNDPQNDDSDGEPIHLDGLPHYRESILGREFLVGPRSFFQPNPCMAEKMVEWLRSRIETFSSRKKLLDLYCGIGTFSILLANLFEQVLGIESVDEAVQYGRMNQPPQNVKLLSIQAEKSMKDHWSHYDTLVVDPPRSGLHPKVLRAVLDHPFQNILYVSCSPRRGVEDMAKLSEQYEIVSTELFDQFPQTPHVELLTHLRRRSGK